MSERETIIQMLEPLIQQAKREGKWLRSTYQGIEFSPEELRKANAEGRFCWGPVNWTLFDPKTLLKSPEDEKSKAITYNARILERME